MHKNTPPEIRRGCAFLLKSNKKRLRDLSDFAVLPLDYAKVGWYTIDNLIKPDETFRKFLTEGGGDSGESLK